MRERERERESCSPAITTPQLYGALLEKKVSACAYRIYMHAATITLASKGIGSSTNDDTMDT